MRIGVDCHVLDGLYQGSRTYLLNLYTAVLQREPQHQFIFYGHFDGYQPFGPDAEYRTFPSRSRLRRLTYLTDRLVRTDKLDLYHTTYISPLRLSCKSLVTVHDILFESMPHYFSRTFVLRSKIFVRKSVRSAAQVQTISQYSQQLISRRYGIDERQVKMVPPGIDLRRFTTSGVEEAKQQIMRQYGLHDYLLTVGRLEPRKNHRGLIEAYAMAKQTRNDLGALVIIGQPDFGYQEFLRRVEELKLSQCVKILSDIPDSDLPNFYKAARIFVYPSFAEGFGIPVLEAMACGVPVIASNTSAIPEVVGDCGVLIDPHDTDALARAINSLADDQARSDRLGAVGAARAGEWSWEHAADKYLFSLNELERE